MASKLADEQVRSASINRRTRRQLWRQSWHATRQRIRKWMHVCTADAPVGAQSKRERAERENEDLRMKYEILKSRLGGSDL
jgi:hypothetical protein